MLSVILNSLFLSNSAARESSLTPSIAPTAFLSILYTQFASIVLIIGLPAHKGLEGGASHHQLVQLL